VAFEGHLRYCKWFIVYLKNTAYNIHSWLQHSDVICEKLFLLSYSIGRTVIRCSARTVIVIALWPIGESQKKINKNLTFHPFAHTSQWMNLYQISLGCLLVDVITSTTFCCNWFRSLESVGGQNMPLPIDLAFCH